MEKTRWLIFCVGVLSLSGSLAFSQSQLAVDPLPPSPLSFGTHDIGTNARNAIIVTNKTAALVDFQVAVTGSDFSSTSNSCQNHLPPAMQCEVIVWFAPTVSGERESTLAISSLGMSPITIALKGTGFPNLSVLPQAISYGNQLVSGSTAPRGVTITNYTGGDLTDLSIAASGDFVETHSSCQILHPNSSCALSVVFAPKKDGISNGSLMVSAKGSSDLAIPRVIALEGNGVLHCNPIGISWSWSTRVLLCVGAVYFIGLALVRWHMIAKPSRTQLAAQIASVRARVESETAALAPSQEIETRKEKIFWLLDLAYIPIKTRSFPFQTSISYELPNYTRIFNAWFWPRGQELAGWNLVHEAEQELVALLPIERVRAWMESVEQKFRSANNPEATGMADRLRDALQQGDVIFQEKLRAVLQQAVVFQAQDVPNAARKALLSNTLQKVADLTDAFIEWNRGTAAATPSDRQSRVRDFSDKFGGASEMFQETRKLLQDWSAGPKTEQALLQRSSAFLERLSKAADKASGQLSDADYSSLSTVIDQLGTDAQDVKNILNVPSQASKDVQDFRDFLTKSKPQMDAFLAVVNAMEPLTAAELLQEIRTLLDADQALLQRLADAQSASTTEAVSGFRPLLNTFAFSLPLTTALEDKIRQEVTRQLPLVVERWRSLLMEALGYLYGIGDAEFSNLADWHSKLIWLVMCALLFMAALAFTFQNGVLLLVGAIGGLLSRLQRNLQAADVPSDYGASWGALFLSPLAGALSAWGGILLVLVGVKLNVFGTALEFNWCNPYDPLVLGLALLFGFLERQFDFAVTQISGKFGAGSSPSPSGTARPTLTVTSTGTLQASAGKETKLNISGTNFQSGVSASFTDSNGKSVKAAIEYKDTNNVIVTLTPPGSTAYQSVLTLTNPDNQSATVKLAVIASQ